MKKILLTIFFVLVFLGLAFPQNNKHEVRSAWITSLFNLDWPSSRSASTAVQKQELISLLSELKDIGLNSVILQIRPESDALYASEYEPWSYWLTGSQGSAPDPYYDPLEFAIEEAHKLGMELHAWFNPYRAERSVDYYATSPDHVTNQHPDWIIQIGTIMVLDPGIPEVRQYVSNVVMDVVNRYDVDGIHFDDYFYPYPPNQISNEDVSTFTQYNRGFSNVGDWRRDNVNLLVQTIFDSIQVVKPNVKFGISPFGIWKNGVPSGIVGLDAYNVIYCDALAWLQDQSIDYLTPQLYWPFGGGQDYGKLLPWWADAAGTYSRHLYSGQAAYRLDSNSGDWPLSEIENQIALNRETDNVYGSVFYRSTLGLTDNPKNFASELKSTIYKYPAIVPPMDWKENLPPNSPENLRYEPVDGEETVALVWDAPDFAADGDSASRYLVYHFEQEPTEPDDLANPTKILYLTGLNHFKPGVPDISSDQFYYAVTALDQNNNESILSNLVLLTAPPAPQLLFPSDMVINQRDTVILAWNHVTDRMDYNLQVSTDPDFTENIVNETTLVDSFFVLTRLEGQQTYFWHVSASNAGGTSEFSDAFSFSTGFPMIPILAIPEQGASDVPLEISLYWYQSEFADTYNLQLNRSSAFSSQFMDLDTILEDTTIFLEDLLSFENYYWRVKAQNEFGASGWSESFSFRTIDISSIEEEILGPISYELKQNYPNPFNPKTTIEFAIAEPGYVSLIIYDLLGRPVAELINGVQQTGRYRVTFDASNYPSGMYIYQLVSKNFRMSRKMMVIK